MSEAVPQSEQDERDQEALARVHAMANDPATYSLPSLGERRSELFERLGLSGTKATPSRAAWDTAAIAALQPVAVDQNKRC